MDDQKTTSRSSDKAHFYPKNKITNLTHKNPPVKSILKWIHAIKICSTWLSWTTTKIKMTKPTNWHATYTNTIHRPSIRILTMYFVVDAALFRQLTHSLAALFARDSSKILVRNSYQAILLYFLHSFWLFRYFAPFKWHNTTPVPHNKKKHSYFAFLPRRKTQKEC